MATVFAFLLLIVNFGISWWNAYAVGRSWADSKAIGGWPRFLVWCAGIMSACGFTWCYTIVTAIAAGALGFLDAEHVRAVIELGYVLIIIPVLGTGMAVWIDSLTTAWRRRDFASIGVASWNTYAQIHNTYSAVQALPGIFKHLGKVFGGSKSDSKGGGAMAMLVMLIVIFALGGGIMTTVVIVRSTARK